MESRNPKAAQLTSPNTFLQSISVSLLIRIGTCLVLAVLLAGIFFVGSRAASPDRAGAAAPGNQSTQAVAQPARSARGISAILRVPKGEGFLPVPQSSPETIETFASDCTTPRSTFILGETVCAITTFVTETDRFVNWCVACPTIAYGGAGVTDITTNAPQSFLYTPTVTGSWKATIADPSDSSIIPVVFDVVNQTAPIATYAADCVTPKTSFNLGDTVCARVVGAPVDPSRVMRQIQFVDPVGFAVNIVDVTTSSQSASFTLPTVQTHNFFGLPIDNRGTWRVNLTDTSDASVAAFAPITVHDPALAVADLEVSKAYSDASNPSAGGTLEVVVWVFNGGPDAAAAVSLTDDTPANTTFLSLTQTDGPTFNCVTPGVGSPGTSTCTLASLAKGAIAGFIIHYQVNGNVGSGTTTTSTATVSSTTTDRNASDNNSDATATLNNPTPPTCTVSCPDNITVGTNAVDGQNNPGAIVNFDNAETFGSCGSGLTSSQASGTFFPVGATLVTQTTGSNSSCSFTVTVVNVPQPTISCPANQSAVAPSGQAETAVSTGTPTFTGSLATLSSTRSDARPVGDPYPIGVTTITWTATDQYGTSASCNQTVTVTSADAPTITCPSNRTFAANAGDCQKTLTAGDIGSPTIGGLNPVLTSSRSDGAALLDPYPAGQTVITWTVTNALGSASCTEVITITTTGDTTPPTLSVPPDLNVTLAAGACTVLLDDELGVATATDNCTPAVNVSRSGVPMVACPIPGNPTRMCESFIFPVGTTDITYTATDAAGNTATGVQHVTVHEPTPPTFTFVPVSMSFNTGAGATSCGTFVGDATLGTATVADNCDTTVIRTGVPAGNIFPVGTTTITYTARADITVTATQIITVVDNTPPVVTAPGPVTLYTGPNATTCGVTVSNLDTTFGTGSATDNCPGVGAVTRSGVPSGNVFPVGTTTLTYSATDAHGNTGSATQVVTVVDNTPPVITLNGQTPSMWPPNHKYQTFLVTNFVTAVTDNCDTIPVSSVVITQVTSDETENGNGDGNTSNDIVIASDCKSVQLRSERDGGGDGRVYTIHFKVVDSHGNVGTATAKVVVQHNPGETPVDSGVHYTVNSNCP